MRRRLALPLLRSAIAATGALLALSAYPDAKQSSPLPNVHDLDANDLGSALQWTFLASAIQNVDVLSLPEPIHMTHEFPIVRLGLVEFLNEHMGFHVLAMEGSLVDAWSTQDRFLASNKSDRDAADAQLALFPLWNTPEIRGLFQYEAASWSTPTPLYITAYDVQPGTGKGTHGLEAFRLLADRLTTYSAPPPSFVLKEWLSDLRPLTNACNEFTPAKRSSVIAAIGQLESWIAAAIPAVTARFPHVPMHAASLRLLPANLRGSLALCSDVTSTPSARYKAVRDREGAVLAEKLRNVSPEAKLVLWAHWSHLTYVDPVAGVSVGQKLKETLGERLYTILPLAERGTAIVIFPSRTSDDDVGLGWVRPASDQFSRRMQSLSSASFFLDLRDPALQTDLAFAGEQSVWVESRAVRVRLLEDTDAIVWLKHVRPPELSLPLLLIMGGMHYRIRLAVFASLVVAGALSVLLWRWRRRHFPANPI